MIDRLHEVEQFKILLVCFKLCLFCHFVTYHNYGANPSFNQIPFMDIIDTCVHSILGLIGELLHLQHCTLAHICG